jgi:hypothetical protein
MSNVLKFPTPADIVTQRREDVKTLCGYIEQYASTIDSSEAFRISTTVVDELEDRYNKIRGWENMTLSESIELLLEFHKELKTKMLIDLLTLEVLKSNVQRVVASKE